MLVLLKAHQRTLPLNCEVLIDCFTFDELHEDLNRLMSLTDVKRFNINYSPKNGVRGIAICRKSEDLINKIIHE